MKFLNIINFLASILIFIFGLLLLFLLWWTIIGGVFGLIFMAVGAYWAYCSIYDPIKCSPLQYSIREGVKAALEDQKKEK